MKEVIPFRIVENLTELHNIASKAGTGADAGLNYYKLGSRNLLFKLEASTRILRFSISKKQFNKAYDQFKENEDVLGTYDYHEALFIGIENKKDIDPKFIAYFKKNKDDYQLELTKFLINKKWIGNKVNTYTELIGEFAKVDYPKAKDLRKDLAEYIINQLNKAQSAYEDGSLDVNDLEGGLHEIRRKLRWISIYAQVCNGWIQLRENKKIPVALNKYLTKEIINSPFNKLPKPPQNFNSLIIDSANFYALSWIISELGKLKDQGLKTKAIKEAISACKIVNKEQIKLIRETYSVPETSLIEIPKQAKLILDTFFLKDQIGQKIITNLEDSI